MRPTAQLVPTSVYRRSFVAVAAALLLTATVAPASAAVDLRGPFLDKAGTPLPFDDDDRVVAFLETAPIVATKKLGKGSTGVLKVTMEQDGVRVHGVFRSINEVFGRQTSTRPNRFAQRDSHLNELAAYRIDRVLGLNRVPPTVRRRVNGRDGSIQLWVENAATEAELIEEGQGLYPLSYHQQQIMRTFDRLISNWDRHQNNSLYDSDGRLWFIDHTRAFTPTPKIDNLSALTIIERDFWQALRNVSDADLLAAVDGVLGRLAADAVVKRRRQLVRHFDELIGERGVDRVVYDLTSILASMRPPQATSVDIAP